MEQKKTLGIVGIVVSAVLAVIMVVTAVLSVSASSFITLWWSSFSEKGNSALGDLTGDQAVENSKNVSVKAMEEGAVLLRNEDNTLPLASGTKVNLFGYYSVKPLTAAGGSSSVGNAAPSADIKQGLEAAGLEVNSSLYTYQYNQTTDDKAGNIFTMETSYTIKEFKYDKIKTDGYIDSAKAYSNIAIYVMSRTASEKNDAPVTQNAEGETGEGKNYLQITSYERNMLENLKKDFSKVIVLLNNATMFEIGCLEEYDIDAVLFMATPGNYGTYGVGNILTGKVSPSGKLSDTYSYDVTDNPAYYTYGTNAYTNASEWSDITAYANKRIKSLDENNARYYHYYEGIYVGYRYYETRFIGDDNVYTAAEEAEYQKHVQYPFGYGLSYTTFSWSDPVWKIGEKGGKISVSVTVTNTGSVEGKDVVEVYLTAPYIKGGIEKSAVELVGYAKTKSLKKGEKDTVTIQFDYDDMASYDYKTEKCYVLDAGEYILSLRSDAHTVKEDLTKKFSVDKKIVYKDSADGKRASDKTEATNQFEEVNAGDGSITYVSRGDWAGTMPTVRDELKPATASASVVAAIKNSVHGSYVDGPDKDEENAAKYGYTAITTDAENGLTIDDVAGLKDYDSPIWDELLDQLSIEDMRRLYGDGAYRVSSVKSIGMKLTVDADGPTGLNATSIGQYGTKTVSPTIWACTWNDELIEELGKCYADEFLLGGAVGIYGPSINIKRTAFNGRNGEYISEDPLLTGKIAAAYVRGYQGEGGYVYLKHYAVYGCAGNASSMVWENEQGIREIYTRAFEIAVKEADAKGMMVSFNKLGTSLNTCNYALLTTLPRSEWGFMGCFVSDGISTSSWDCNLGVRAGLDLILDSSWDAQMISWADATVDSSVTKSVYGQNVLRESAKRLIYRYANSAAVTAIRDFTPTWIILVVALEVVFAAAIAACAIFLIKPAFFKKK